jgi:hypothetical protein
MRDIKNLFAEGHVRGFAKLGGLGGFLLALIAFALVANFWNAKNMYTRIPATIMDITMSTKGKTVWTLTYEYQNGREKVIDKTSCPESMATSLQVGGTILLLQDPETGETMFADNEKYIQAFSLKLGFVGVVLMIGAYVFLRMNPNTSR